MYTNSVNRVRTPFAQGTQREVFYSPKYKVVIKKPIKRVDSYGGVEYSRSGTQATIREWELFCKLTESERKFFPFIDFMYDKEKQPTLIMEKVKVDRHLVYNALYVGGRVNSIEGLDRKGMRSFCGELGYYKDIVIDPDELYDLVHKYKLYDLHAGNVGYNVKDKRFLIIDAIVGW